MPGSLGDNDDWIKSQIYKMVQETKPSVRKFFTSMDVGPGRGKYGIMIGDLDVYFSLSYAIEIWEPYIDEFGLDTCYDFVINMDAREYYAQDPEFHNLVIFGDVLEHMTREESIKIFNEASQAADWIIVSVPIIHWPQGAEFNNPYEIHVQEHLTPGDIEEMFGTPTAMQLSDKVGAFVFDVRSVKNINFRE